MTNLDIAFHDTALAQIDEFIAAHAPERGGALLGPVGQPVVSEFIADPDAQVTGSTYTPSNVLRAAILEKERFDRTLEFKGIVHSHPGRFAQPSSGDEIAFTNNLRNAPWLGRFICPIVTSRVDDMPHRLQLRNGTLSVHVAEPRAGDDVVVEPAHPRILPIGRDITMLAATFNAVIVSRGMHAQISGTLYSLSILASDNINISVLFPPTYPTLPPIVILQPTAESPIPGIVATLYAHELAQSPKARTVAIPLRWNLQESDDSRLVKAIAAAIEPVTIDRILSHPSVPSADSAPAEGAQVAREGIQARLSGAVTNDLTSSHVVIAGLGSGGSQTAEALVRTGVENITVVDPDEVSAENLSRSTYTLADVGRQKTEALADRLRAINPIVRLRTYSMKLEEIPSDELRQLIKGSDLVIGATDSPTAQLRLNHLAWSLGVPAVFAGLYARGHAGEIVFTVPGMTRCFRCATSRRTTGSQDAAGMNYGTGQLLAEPALGADISHIVSASVKIAIGILDLARGGITSAAASLIVTALANRRQFLIMSTVPNYEFFPKIFGDTPGQHGYQSVWMSVEGDSSCRTCGTSPAPAHVDILVAVDLNAIQAAVVKSQNASHDHAI